MIDRKAWLLPEPLSPTIGEGLARGQREVEVAHGLHFGLVQLRR